MTNLVVGLDASEHDRAITDWAARFAADYDLHLIVVNVVPRTILWMIAGAQADSSRYLRAVRGRFEREVIAPMHAAGISAEFRLELGDPAHQLVGVAVKTGAELIAIGGPEHSALHDVVLGGVARRLEHHTHVPVVVIPHSSSHAPAHA